MQTFPTPGKTRVVVINPLDVVELSADADATTTVELIPRGDEGEAVASETTVTCTESGGVNTVTVTLPNARSFSRRRSGLTVRISAPEGTDVTVSTQGVERSLLSLARDASGDVRLRGTVGDVDISIPSGDVSAEVISGSLSLKSASGDVSARRVDGVTKVRTVSGDVSIDETKDDASVTVVSGDVSIGDATRPVDVTSVSGDVTVIDARDGLSCKSTSGDVTVRRAWSGSVKVATVSGDLEVGIPTGRSVSVDAKSMSGDLSSEIDLGVDGGPSEGDAQVVVKISAHSVSGDVSIRRASAVAA